jgi:hypothetical protein
MAQLDFAVENLLRADNSAPRDNLGNGGSFCG